MARLGTGHPTSNTHDFQRKSVASRRLRPPVPLSALATRSRVRERAALEALEVAGGVHGEEVARLDAADVLVEDGLDALDDGAALPGIALADQLGQQPLLLPVAPPARPVALSAPS
jgi:hypothetical protein